MTDETQPDPSSGSDTPLARELKEAIEASGPLTVEQYMALCLGHPRHGYYMTRDPLGIAGDFVTAPEISQMFGELIGLWSAEVWRLMGEPGIVNLVELGPGRGTLMADALRAARAMPDFHAAINVHFVETSPVLRKLQTSTLAKTGFDINWHDTVETLPEGPTIVIANEFFDALPIRQYVRTEGHWHERLVGLDSAGELTFGLTPAPESALNRDAPDGVLMEFPAAAIITMRKLAEHIARNNGALLVIDYGYLRTGYGETLQAVRNHTFTGLLKEPGEADITAHVDFSAMTEAARRAGATVQGPASQSDYLLRLGIRERAAALSRHATPEQADAVAAALERLTDTGRAGMGQLFKVIAATHASLPLLPGFDTLHKARQAIPGDSR